MAYQDLKDTDAAIANGEATGRSTTVLVSRRETFNAAHQLRDPDRSDEDNERLFGKCANLHGHNYVLEIVVAGEVQDDTGYVMDLKELSDIIHRRVIQDVDHRNLNTDVPWLDGRIPTAENLALAFWERIESELPDGRSADAAPMGDGQELGRGWRSRLRHRCGGVASCRIATPRRTCRC